MEVKTKALAKELDINHEEVTEPVKILKIELGSRICKIIEKMETTEVLEATKLDKSDLSRLKVGSLSRFSLDRLVNLLAVLGYKTKLSFVKDKKASHNMVRRAELNRATISHPRA